MAEILVNAALSHIDAVLIYWATTRILDIPCVKIDKFMQLQVLQHSCYGEQAYTQDMREDTMYSVHCMRIARAMAEYQQFSASR